MRRNDLPQQSLSSRRRTAGSHIVSAPINSAESAPQVDSDAENRSKDGSDPRRNASRQRNPQNQQITQLFTKSFSPQQGSRRHKNKNQLEVPKLHHLDNENINQRHSKMTMKFSCRIFRRWTQFEVSLELPK